ncbi:hypothetical protein LCGC14_2987900, partial [marine sediment metagenome]
MTINDVLYAGCVADTKLSLSFTGLSFVETTASSGVFEGTLKLPTEHCDKNGVVESTNGLDIDFEYQDFSDNSGNPNESSSKAAIQSNTGFVSLDRTVYPVPIGTNDFVTHAVGKYLDATPVNIVIQVNDPDFNISANGEDDLDKSNIKLFVKRGSDKLEIDLSTYGNLVETDPESGIFELDVELNQGTSTTAKLDAGGYIKQGDILQVEYSDPNDASGELNTVTDSATFDLRNAVLQTDKSIYVIGQNAIITLIEPDLNLDSETEETWTLDL